MERLYSNLPRRIQFETFTTSGEPDRTARELLSEIVNSETSQAEKLRAGMQLTYIPLKLIGIDAKQRIMQKNVNQTNLPLQGEWEYFTAGWESFIFRNDTGNLQILKVNKHTIGQPLRQQIEKVKVLKKNYNQIKKWYSEVDDFVTPCEFFIARLPYNNLESVATLQPFIQNPRDLFSEFTNQQRRELFQDNALRNNLISFIKTFMRVYFKTNQALDLAGDKNISITEEKGKPKLTLLESSDIKNITEWAQRRRAHKFIKEQTLRINKLQEMYKEVQSLNSSVSSKLLPSAVKVPEVI